MIRSLVLLLALLVGLIRADTDGGASGVPMLRNELETLEYGQDGFYISDAENINRIKVGVKKSKIFTLSDPLLFLRLLATDYM